MVESSLFAGIGFAVAFFATLGLGVYRLNKKRQTLPKADKFIAKVGSSNSREKSVRKKIKDAHLAIITYNAFAAGTISWFVIQLAFILMMTSGIEVTIPKDWHGGPLTVSFVIGVLVLQVIRLVRNSL